MASDQIVSIIIALIVSGCSLWGTKAGAKMGVEQANKLTVYRIKELEKKVDKHNNLQNRMLSVEKEIPRIDEKIDDAVALTNQKIKDQCKFTDARLTEINVRMGARL